MPVTVSLQIFSGNQNPTWTLTDSQEEELTRLVSSRSELAPEKPPGIVSGLGYKGFKILSSKSLTYAYANIIDTPGQSPNLVDDKNIEKWLLNSAGENIDKELKRIVEEGIDKELKKIVEGIDNEQKKIVEEGIDNEQKGIQKLRESDLLYHPAYDSKKWGNDLIRNNNNCYNYATDKITNTFAQPGKGSGKESSTLVCIGVGNAAIRDRLTKVEKPQAGANPIDGHYAALVIWPGRDYHWYRLDKSNTWSHKPGSLPCTQVDGKGQIIKDPERCYRGYYIEFCGYFKVPKDALIR